MGIFSYGCWDLRVLFDQLDETYMVAADFDGATNTYLSNGIDARRHQDRSRLADKTDFDRDLLCSVVRGHSSTSTVLSFCVLQKNIQLVQCCV